MSSKEKQAKRQAKQRLKIKESDEAYQSYVKKDQERKKAQRSASKAAMTTSQLDEHRMKERQRAREYRQRRKESQPIEIYSPTSTPYSTTQTRGKAIKRASLALPLSPRKKHCVVRSIAESIGFQVNVSPLSTSQGHGALSEETKQLVHAFYNSNDTSWQAPGRKDRIIIRETTGNGEKIKRTEQLRYMLMSLKEAYNKFVKENPNNKVGLSKFCELRPAKVKLFDHIPHNVCVCSYHENVRLLLVALKIHTTLSQHMPGLERAKFRYSI